MYLHTEVVKSHDAGARWACSARWPVAGATVGAVDACISADETPVVVSASPNHNGETISGIYNLWHVPGLLDNATLPFQGQATDQLEFLCITWQAPRDAASVMVSSHCLQELADDSFWLLADGQTVLLNLPRRADQQLHLASEPHWRQTKKMIRHTRPYLIRYGRVKLGVAAPGSPAALAKRKEDPTVRILRAKVTTAGAVHHGSCTHATCASLTQTCTSILLLHVSTGLGRLCMM